MTNNDALRSIRYLLNVGDAKIIEIIQLTGLSISQDELTPYLLRDTDTGYVPCPDRVMSHFLNGLVIYKRGKDEGRAPAPIERRISNNLIAKKLRVAFELKDTNIIELVGRAGLNVSKTEVGAFFRSPDHRNFRECGDQFLRYLLKGLTK